MKSRAITNKESLHSLRNIGPKLEEKLNLIGIDSIDEFLAVDPEVLYEKLEKKLGCHVDPCVLYAFKGAQINLPWPECKRFYADRSSAKKKLKNAPYRR